MGDELKNEICFIYNQMHYKQKVRIIWMVICMRVRTQ